jgi:K+ transporter
MRALCCSRGWGDSQSEAAQGGYVPLALAGAVYLIVWIWHRRAAAVAARIHEDLIPIDTFMAKLERDRVPRVPGTAVLAITTQIEPVPWIADEKRATVAQYAAHVTDYFNLPGNQVVEIGRQIAV